MVDVIGRAKVIITGDVDPTSIDAAGGKIGGRIRAGAAVGVAALGTLAVAGVKAFEAFEEAEAQSRKLNNVLDNMGKSEAAPAVEKLADELMRLTGIDDEVIKGGQTILATFTAVSESAGEVGGTFDRATRAAVDMSSVFGSVESASRTLGKALSDPEKAAALLKRSNVILNEEQTKLIENFLAANDAAGAQDVILDALEDRYKGTAEAAAVESQKIAVAWGEVQESVGLALSELTGGEVESFSEALLELADSIEDLAESKGWARLGKKFRELNKDVRDNSTFLGQLDQRNKDVVRSFGSFARSVEDAAERIRDAWNGIPDILSDFGDFVGNISPFARNRIPESPEFGGGRTRASGGPARGLTLVGENGPELAMFSGSGGYVYNNSQTRDMLSKASSASIEINNNFYGPENLSQARRMDDWSIKHGTRFGAATSAGAL